MERKDFDKWVQGYIACWTSNDPEAIGALFSEDAKYLTQAFRQPWQGRETIVKEWIERKDDPENPEDAWSFDYHWIAVEGDTGVLEGLTDYTGRGATYQNIWQITLDGEGRCGDFKEYWIKKLEES